jgi:hypothetical protein
MNMTDGYIYPDVPQAMLSAKPSTIKRVVDCGLWLAVDAGGWQMNDWDAWQPTRAQIAERRELAADRKRKERQRKGFPDAL